MNGNISAPMILRMLGTGTETVPMEMPSSNAPTRNAAAKV